ncbi:MAG: flavodoxin family protein [Thermoplasmata archaeon]|nr:flavodoxin family protein [Thermoplasmata archaeon]
MSRKILIIDGSPRRGGNTDILCDSFATGARENGSEVETIYPSRMKIAYCTGCDRCIETGRCVHKDDMEEVRDKMLSADIIVFAAPVYFYTIPAQIKVLIDRMVPFYQKVTGKDIYIMVCAADPNDGLLELAVEAFRGLTRDCMEGCTEKGTLKATGVWKKGEVSGTEFPDMARKMGRSA